jgi:hypothetical protein
MLLRHVGPMLGEMATAYAAHRTLPRIFRRRLRGDRVWRRWTAAWVGGSVLGIVNGVVRELAYRDLVGEQRANQIAVAILIGLLALYFWMLERRWPIPTTRAALRIGMTWAALTVTFEFLFGHWVDGKTWSELFNNYDVAEGRLWIFALVWIALGPAVVRRVRRTERGTL